MKTTTLLKKTDEDIEWTKWPDGSVTTIERERKVDKRTRVLAEALFEIQKRMPAGQVWCLHSHGACRQIADHLNDRLNEWEDLDTSE